MIRWNVDKHYLLDLIENGVHIPDSKFIKRGCPELPVYARADIFYDTNNELALGELELVEPELWFRIFPKAAHALALAL